MMASCCRQSSRRTAGRLLVIQLTVVGAALLCLFSLRMTAAAISNGNSEAGRDDAEMSTELSGAMIPSYNSMASLQQALSHNSWLEDTEALRAGRSLLRRKKRSGDGDGDDDDDDDEKDEDGDDEDSDDDEEEEEENDKKKRKKRKKRGKSKAIKLLGVQLDMTMLTAGPVGGNEDEDEDDDEDDDEDEDDNRRRRRHLLATAAAAAPSTELKAYAKKESKGLFPEATLIVIGKLPRSEAEAGCGNVALGTVEFSIDLKKMLQVDGVDDGDDVSKLKVVHHLRCVVPDPKDKSKMLLDPKIKTQHFFVVVTIKSTVAAVDCPAGAVDCIVYGSQSMLSAEDLAQIKASSTKGRSLLADLASFTQGILQKPAEKPAKGSSDAARLKHAKDLIQASTADPVQGPTHEYRSKGADKKSTEVTYKASVERGTPGLLTWTEDYEVQVNAEKNLDTGKIKVTYTIFRANGDNWFSEQVTVIQAKSKCFPAAARVLLSNGTQATMQQLRHGDRVLTVLPGGQLGFSEVYLFGHKDPDSLANFMELQTEINTTLLATPDHYIHIIPRSKAAAGTPLSWKDAVHTRAGKVQPGDVMVHVSWDNCASPSDIASHKGSSCGSMQYVTITSAKMQVAKGLYNPYTMVGNIVVDGYSASSHSGLDFLDPLTGTGPYVPHLHQAMLSPLRLIQRLYPSLMAHVDQQYSRDAWSSAGVANVIGSIVQYHLKGA